MREIIAVYGGTFDPPHLGHEAVLAAACGTYSRALVIPARRPPHKELDGLTPGHEHRYEMARLLVSAFPNASVSRIELSQDAPRYTVDTLEAVRALYPDWGLALVVGGDMFMELPKWRDFGSIARMAEIAVARRTEARDAALNAAETYRREYGARVKFLDFEPADVSSTAIRAALSREDARRAVSGLPERVRAYILENGLYVNGRIDKGTNTGRQ